MKQILFIIMLLTACSPNSLEEFHQEGEAQIKRLTQELQAIQSREELQKEVMHLQKRFDTLVDLIIDARRYQEKHPEEDFEVISHTASELLLEEMRRIYLLENGKELMEKAEREPLLRLDAFERALLKKKERMK